eukprot:UN28347
MVYYVVISVYSFTFVILSFGFYQVLTNVMTCSMINYYCRMCSSFLYRLGTEKDLLELTDKRFPTFSLAESCYVNFDDWFVHFELRKNMSYPFSIWYHSYSFFQEIKNPQSRAIPKPYSDHDIQYRAGQL